MDRVAGRGIVSRAVLVDIPRFMTHQGVEWNPLVRHKIDSRLLDECVEWQGCPILEGDVLLLRTGWLAAWMALPDAVRAQGRGENPGLDPDRSSAAWLWNRGISAIACDNMAVEPLPLKPKEEGFLHFRILPLLGMMMGEQFDFEGLAEDCSRDRVYDSFFTSSPLRIPHGVCSPPNALAIK